MPAEQAFSIGTYQQKSLFFAGACTRECTLYFRAAIAVRLKSGNFYLNRRENLQI